MLEILFGRSILSDFISERILVTLLEEVSALLRLTGERRISIPKYISINKKTIKNNHSIRL